ncbi:hypothetical protein CC78DRAFT_545097 [Lojkania enalia]|uniref:BTB domain-containing protein n=1 Tax=Lojkania enalia TaxID=147567 RepID=A0A9P4K6Z4_9PLEO|nr:hypothetical protein CC78DRAFT_545097 [Didymosphaeria enalia]
MSITIDRHDIDPNGDTLLILKRPCAELAEWQEQKPGEWKILSIPKREDSDGQSVSGKRKRGKKAKNGIMQSSVQSEEYQQIAQSEAAAVDAQGTVLGSSVPLENFNATCRSPHSTVDEVHAEEEDVEPEIHYRVSSGQLKITSVFFQHLFKTGYKETIPDESDGLFHIEALDWDVDAMLIVLNIMHARNELVDRKLDLLTLVKVAVILKRAPLPRSYGPDSIMWIFVSSVFADRDVLKRMTALAARQSLGPFQTLGLPIPENVVESIDEQRRSFIDEAIVGLHELLARLRDREEAACSTECRAILLGSLILSMHSNHLLMDLSSRPQSPFAGLSVDSVDKNLRDIASAMQNNHCLKRGRIFSLPCNLENLVDPLLKSIASSKFGLESRGGCL